MSGLFWPHLILKQDLANRQDEKFVQVDWYHCGVIFTESGSAEIQPMSACSKTNIRSELIALYTKLANSPDSDFGWSKGKSNAQQLGEADIADLPVADNTVDVVISNGAINFAENKSKVFVELFRVLKPGGRLQNAKACHCLRFRRSLGYR
jgi:SAM-dependent methyltransferase